MSAPPLRNFILSHDSPVAPDLENPIHAGDSDLGTPPEVHDSARSEMIRGIAPSHSDALVEQFGPPNRSQSDIETTLETSLRGIAATERTGDLAFRPYFYHALRDLHQLMVLTEGETRLGHARDFIGVGERYINFLNRSELPPSECFHFLYPAMQFVHASLRTLNQESGPNPTLNLMQDLLRQFHATLISYHQEMRAGDDPLAEPTRGLVLDIQVREALLDGDYETAAVAASHLAQFRQSRPLPTTLQPTAPWYNRWEVQVRAGNTGDPEQLSQVISQLQNPPQVTHPAAMLSALSFDLFSRMAAGLDAANEVASEQITRRFNLMTLMATPLMMARPVVSLENILTQLNTDTGRNRAAALLNQAMAVHPSLREQWEELFPDTPVNDALVELGAIASDWLAYASGPGQRVMAPLLHANAESLEADIGPHDDPEEVLTNFASPLVEIYQAMLGDAEAHEIAALHSVARYLSQQEEISPGTPLPPVLVAAGEQMTNYFDSWEFRLGQILEPLVSASGLFIMGTGLLFAELFPAFLIGRAGTSGRLAGLIEGGRLTVPGAMLTGFSTGVVLSGVGSAVHNSSRAYHGLSTHFWRDFGTGSLINGVTFMTAMGAGAGMQRILHPGPEQGRLLGRVPWGRHLAIRGTSAFAGGTVAWLGGTALRGALSGEWSTSADEAAANYLTMAVFELGAMGFSALRHRAALRSELGLYHSSEGSLARTLESGASRILVNRFFPVLGARRVNYVDYFTNMVMREPQAIQEGSVIAMGERFERFPGERNLIHRQMGLEEMLHPGFLERLFQTSQPLGLVTLGENPPSEIAWSSNRYDPRAPQEPRGPEPGPRRPAQPRPDPEGRNVQQLDAHEIARRVAETQARQEAEGEGPAASQPPVGPTQAMVSPSGREIAPGHMPLYGVEDNAPGQPRQARIHVHMGQLGEVSALTEVGGRQQNEDGVGLWYDREGRAVLMVADGMGGHQAGDAASAAAIRGFFDFLMARPDASIFEAFEAGHQQVQQLPRTTQGPRQGDPGAAASAVRIDPSGRVEMAQIADTQVFVARWQTDGSYVVERVATPDTYAGRISDQNSGSMNTAQIHAAEGPLGAIGAFLGRPGHPLTAITRVGEASNIGNAVVYRPEALRLMPNDILLIMSDGIEGQFRTRDFARMLHGRSDVDQIAQIIRDETIWRQETLQHYFSAGIQNRVQLPNGQLQGHFLDSRGHLYGQAEGGDAIGALTLDNISLIVYRHRGVQVH